MAGLLACVLHLFLVWNWFWHKSDYQVGIYWYLILVKTPENLIITSTHYCCSISLRRLLLFTVPYSRDIILQTVEGLRTKLNQKQGRKLFTHARISLLFFVYSRTENFSQPLIVIFSIGRQWLENDTGWENGVVLPIPGIGTAYSTSRERGSTARQYEKEYHSYKIRW